MIPFSFPTLTRDIHHGIRMYNQRREGIHFPGVTLGGPAISANPVSINAIIVAIEILSCCAHSRGPHSPLLPPPPRDLFPLRECLYYFQRAPGLGLMPAEAVVYINEKRPNARARIYAGAKKRRLMRGSRHEWASVN